MAVAGMAGDNAYRTRVLEELYDAFDARDVEAALAHLAPGVDWTDAATGARIHGREATPRHLRSMLTLSRAAALGHGVLPVLEALAQLIRAELSFQVVAINLLDDAGADLRAVVVEGDEDARQTLLGLSARMPKTRIRPSARRDLARMAWCCWS